MAAAGNDYVDEKTQLLLGQYQLGEDVRAFLQSDTVGQYLHHRIKQTISQCECDALAVDVDGWRGWFFARRKLRAIRERAAAAKLLLGWLGDALQDGNNAEAELNELGMERNVRGGRHGRRDSRSERRFTE